MRFFIKNIPTAVLTVLLTYFYFKGFYGQNRLLLVLLLVLSIFISLLITLPRTERKKYSLLLAFVPFLAVYILTHNYLFFIAIALLSVLISFFVPKRKIYTKYLFTDSNIVFKIKKLNKRCYLSVCRNIFSTGIFIVLLFGFIFTKPSLFWLNRAFPIDFSYREVIGESVVPSGLVTATAWYDENALLLDSFYDIDGTIPSPGKEAGLKVGDVITHINSQRALISDFIVNGADENEITLNVRRYNESGESEELSFTLTPVFSEKDKLFRIGITYYATAVMTSSVQTMTFFHPETGDFAATAHSSEEIYNNIETLKGIIFSAKTTGRDSDGLTAALDEPIGETLRTDNYGSYGKLTNIAGDAIPLAQKKDFARGYATLLSAFEGNEIREYQIYITGTYRIDNRDVMCFIVTDKAIINAGGITRGMSGSPIIQHGKLIGALSNMDSGGKTGYGTFACDMAHNIYLNQ